MKGHRDPKKVAGNIFSVLFALLAVWFIVQYALGLDWKAVSALHVRWEFVVPALGIGVAYLVLTAFIWVRMLRRMNPAVSFDLDLLAVYAKAWMGRYIPGKVTWIAGKIHFASKKGIPASQLGVSSLLDAGVQMATQVALSLVILALYPGAAPLDPVMKAGLLFLVAVMVAVLVPPVFNRITGLGLRILRREIPHNIRLTGLALGEMSALYAIAYVVIGIMYSLVAFAVLPSFSLELCPYLVASSGIAGALGILALFAPSGLGVREGVSILFLTPVMGAEQAFVCALAMRLATFAMDLAFVGSVHLAVLLLRGKKRQLPE